MRSVKLIFFALLLSAQSYGQAASSPSSAPVQATSPASTATSAAPANTPKADSPAEPALPADPIAIFDMATPVYDFASSKLTPWHISVSYQLFDDKNQPAITGTYDYWWASPDTYRSSWKRGGSERTDLHVKGEHYVAEKGGQISLLELRIEKELLAPLPKKDELNPEKVEFTRQEQTVRNTKVPCVMVTPKMQSDAAAEKAPMGMFPTYCFSPSHPILVTYYAYGSTALVYDQVAEMQGMYLARSLTVFENRKHILSAKVDMLVSLKDGAKEFAVTPEMKLVKDRRINVSSGVAVGQLLKKVPPIYPQDAREKHISGVVVLEATIGVDGRVHELSAVSGPSPSLVAAAMGAVARWEYEPFVFQGELTEMHTNIDVIYTEDKPAAK